MYCRYCGTHMQEDARFCSVCGKVLDPEAELARENRARGISYGTFCREYTTRGADILILIGALLSYVGIGIAIYLAVFPFLNPSVVQLWQGVLLDALNTALVPVVFTVLMQTTRRRWTAIVLIAISAVGFGVFASWISVVEAVSQLLTLAGGILGLIGTSRIRSQWKTCVKTGELPD